MSEGEDWQAVRDWAQRGTSVYGDDAARPEVVEDLHRLAAVAEARGDTHSLSELRSVELASRLARGERGTRAEVDWLIEAARAMAAAEYVVLALATAAAVLAAETAERTSTLLAEIERVPGARESPYYARDLAAMVRTALAAGDHADAAILYAEAAARWQEFGNVPERAHAHLGQGRCLLALNRAEAEQPLREARDLFAAMGYKPAFAETEALSEQVAAAPAS